MNQWGQTRSIYSSAPDLEDAHYNNLLARISRGYPLIVLSKNSDSEQKKATRDYLLRSKPNEKT
jgi:hypothetical protein